jgi:hypothetical protein
VVRNRARCRKGGGKSASAQNSSAALLHRSDNIALDPAARACLVPVVHTLTDERGCDALVN